MKISLLCFFVFGTIYLSESLPTNHKQNDDEVKVKDILERLLEIKSKKHVKSLFDDEYDRKVKKEDDKELTGNQKKYEQSVEEINEERRIKEDQQVEQYNKMLEEKRKIFEEEMKELTQKNEVRRHPDNSHHRNTEETLEKSLANGKLTKKSSDSETVKGHKELPIDNPENVDPNSPLEFLMEGMIVEQNGKKHKVKGLRPEDNAKTIGDSLDSHKIAPQGPHSNTDDVKRNFITDSSMLWDKGIVPYRIHNMSTNGINIINQAIQQFNDYTCVRWVPESTMASYNLNHKNVIYFINEIGCWSWVGNIYWTDNVQEISLQEPGCTSVATAIHEMLHALGSHHEQSRMDRDNYVDIAFENVQGGTNNGNMAKINTQINNPYDAESTMQYGLYSFSVNGEKTILFKDQRLEFLADDADGLEYYDIQDVNAVYNCSGHCINAPKCQNGGYVNFKCVCACPDKLRGAECTQTVSNIVADSYSCGGVIELGTGIQYIQSPNFGTSNYPTGLDCTWLIKGQPNNIVRATVQYMDIAAGSACYHFLEFRYNLLGQTGPKRCGTNFNDEIWDSTVDEISNEMIISFNSDLAKTVAGTSGFKIKLESIGKGCVSNPCVYGSCYSPVGTSSYTCTCNPGVTGPNCDILSASASVGCTFEYGERCFLTQDKTDKFDWVFASDGTPSSSTGPSNAHGGYQFMYTEASSPRVSGETAVLVNTVVQLASSTRCLSFWYHMYGAGMGTLNVYTEGLNVPKSVVFTASGNKGDQWLKQEVDIPALTNLKVYFEGVRGSGWDSDMALDDILLKPGTCANPITQAPTTQAPTTKATTTQAPTTKAPTTQAPTTKAPTTQAPTTKAPTTKAPTTKAPTTQAPTTKAPTTKAPTTKAPTTKAPTTKAPTTQAPTTKAPTTKAPTTQAPTTKAPTTQAPTTKAPTTQAPTTKAPTTQATTTKAPTTQAPTTKAPTTQAPTTKAPTTQAPTTKAPTTKAPTTQVPTTKAPTTQAPTIQAPTTKAPTTQAPTGNIVGHCFVNPCSNGGSCSESSATQEGYICTCPTGFVGVNCDLFDATRSKEIKCGFEQNENCIFSDDTSGDFNWDVNSGSTPSSGTGPSQAYEGNQYIYTEASSKTEGETAVLSTANSKLEGLIPYCVQFYYHMYGNPGSLSVSSTNRGLQQPTVQWSMSGDQGDQWIYQKVEVPAVYNDPVIYITGVVGSTFQGDIAIDSLVLSQGRCPNPCGGAPCDNGGSCIETGSTFLCVCSPGYTGTLCETKQQTSPIDTFTCDFEDGEFCIFTDSKKDDFDWTRATGTTPSSGTGPDGANSGSYYMYTEVSSPVQNQQKAVLTTESNVLQSSPWCLTFSYQMKGYPGTLGVAAGEKGKVDAVIWFVTGSQGDNWKTVSINVPQFSNPEIQIHGKKGDSWQGDIAIDSLVLNKGVCVVPKNRYTCDFEDSESCIFTDSSNDDFDWTRRTGTTPSSGTGPDGALSGLYYMYIEVSSPVQDYQKAVLTTENVLLKSSPWCLTFSYHMKGYPGTLGVAAGEKGQVDTASAIWSKTGSQGDNWNTVSVDIPQLSNPEIQIRGSKGTSFQGDIAIDNLILEEGQCTASGR